MKFRPIIIVPGDPFSIFIEIFFKSLLRKYKSPLILIYCKKDLNLQMKKFGFKKRINLINPNNFNEDLDNKKINLIDIEFKKSKDQKIRSQYIKKCLQTAFKLIKNGFTHKFINGPIDKKKILNKKYLGMTEYIASKFHQKNFAMLIFNRKLSVCPLTTHLPLKDVSKNINQRLIIKKIKIINQFYRKHLKFKPRIAVTGLNPHCESVNKFNEDENIVLPAIKKSMKMKINVKGPFPADTIFLKNNRKKFDIIIGMYHDQVIGPFKTLFEYDAINISTGLPFLRVTPDHGPNFEMIGKNKSDPTSLIKCLNFLDNR
jgi:4-hydroxythreonine-4-phosphate dehydrogenase